MPPDMVRTFNNPEGELPSLVRILTALKLQWLYLWKLLVPMRLQGIYIGVDFPGLIRNFLTAAGLAVSGGFLLLCALGVWGWRKHSQLALCFWLYMVSFSVTSNLLFPIGATFAERLAYFPSIWFCALIALLLTATFKHPRVVPILWIVALLCLTLLTVRCLVRNVDYSSGINLWTRDVELDSTNVCALSALAESYASAGRFADADRTYQQGFKAPGGENPQSLLSYANYLLRQGRYAEAMKPAEKSLEQSRIYNDPDAIYAMGFLAFAHTELRQFNEALYWLERGGTFFREPSGDWDLRGRVLEGLGRDQEAAAAYAKVEVWPPLSDGPQRFGLCLLRIGRVDEALPLLRQAVEKVPTAAAWNGYGVALAQQGKRSEAAAAFRQALEMEPGNAQYRGNLERIQSAGTKEH